MVETDHPMLSIALQSEEAGHPIDDDGSNITVIVRNALPCVSSASFMPVQLCPTIMLFIGY